jgi:hypothetical protein
VSVFDAGCREAYANLRQVGRGAEELNELVQQFPGLIDKRRIRLSARTFAHQGSFGVIDERALGVDYPVKRGICALVVTPMLHVVHSIRQRHDTIPLTIFNGGVLRRET